MVDGEFYDAGAYKADPVPMALQYETVYEGFKTGVSQGLFTVKGAAENKQSGNWFADGIWRTEAQIQAEKEKEKARAAKLAQTAPQDQELGGPPKLRRGPGSSSSGDAPSTKPRSAPTPPTEKTTKPPSGEAKPSSTSSAADASLGPENAPDRPILRREPQTGTPQEQTKASPETAPLKGPLQVIPAISDAAGPQSRPYTYELKPDEKQAFTKKLLAMAADQVNNRAKLLESELVGAKPANQKGRATAPKPQFQNVQLRVFDVSTSNEAVAVLTADATLPSRGDLVFSTVVVARQDIYGDLQKIFAQTTDNKHLDLAPRYELIDAVDADGDGRAELLFREAWDSGSGYGVFRVLGDRLWPLFESKPGS